ncbi:hypothetical protein KIW84_034458 [Lathyrus oleraceus]|uniref:Retroviral polymerase SH3-like domain-containing protein n=1 Tax=Pisum sativum TaxID=3888 RepID=A0A9D5B578_PEA|nr:hypothetical protein KIW84_034458 [Pisum sativum]
MTSAYTLNRVPSKKVDKTPYEIWSGKRPHMSYMKIWGCEVYVKRQISTNLEPKSDQCLFVGYPKETRGYYFYNPSEGKVFVARTGVFLEKDFNSKGTSGRKHCIVPFASSARSSEELGQTDQEISQPSKQVCFSRSQGPRVGPTCSHDLGILLKCLSQGLDVQKSSVHAQSVRNPRKSKLVNCG